MIFYSILFYVDLKACKGAIGKPVLQRHQTGNMHLLRIAIALSVLQFVYADINVTSEAVSPGRIQHLTVTNMAAPLGTAITSIVGNVIAIFVIWRNQRRSNKQSVFYTLVMTLACLDFISTAMTSPITFVAYSTGKSLIDLGGVALCFYSGVAMVYFGVVSMAIVFTMSIERLIAIRFAFFYHTKVTALRTKIAVIVVSVICLLLAALPLVGFGQIHLQRPGTWCFLNWKATEAKHQAFNLLIASLGIIMMIGTIFCNFYVVTRVILKKRKMKIKNSTLQVMSKTRLRKIAYQETQMMVLLFLMTCVFILCYLPLLVRIIINQITAMNNTTDPTASWNLFAVHMAAINPVLDPWVYILCRRETIVGFFNALKLLVTCKCSKQEVSQMFSSGRKFRSQASTQSFKNTTRSMIGKKRDSTIKREDIERKFAQKWIRRVGQQNSGQMLTQLAESPPS
ncbi:prostacyclin receptor-like isoform X2 [Clavelina lepadiformis]|uniref:Thromboxane A2 receptor n=1 Tax=Clavelina lepadiformis TaxID=159417 RepID=A0ABP0GDR5_CLALP